MKSFWFVVLLCVCCSSAFGQQSPMIMPTPDPISTTSAEELPSCDELYALINVYDVIIGVLQAEVDKNQTEVENLSMQISQNEMDIFAAISANASSTTLINLKTKGQSLTILRNIKRAQVTANQALLTEAYSKMMSLYSQLYMGMCW